MKVEMEMNNLDAEQYLEMNKDSVEILAEKLWDAYNEFDFDPMCPQWHSFEDEIKDKFREAASKLIIDVQSLDESGDE